MDVTNAAEAAMSVGKTHGFEAMLVVLLLAAIAGAAWVLLSAHLRLSARLTSAQESAYEANTNFATSTASATQKMADGIKQMAETTRILQQGIETVLAESKASKDVVEELLRRSSLAQQAAADVLFMAAEQIDPTDHHRAETLRRIANALLPRGHHQHHH